MAVNRFLRTLDKRVSLQTVNARPLPTTLPLAKLAAPAPLAALVDRKTTVAAVFLEVGGLHIAANVAAGLRSKGGSAATFAEVRRSPLASLISVSSARCACYLIPQKCHEAIGHLPILVDDKDPA